ncbi:MAG: hypothetical protein AAF196_00255 [Planctomycetota bacterium]
MSGSPGVGNLLQSTGLAARVRFMGRYKLPVLVPLAIALAFWAIDGLSSGPPVSEPNEVILADPPPEVFELEEAPDLEPRETTNAIGRRTESDKPAGEATHATPVELRVRVRLADGRAAGAGYTVTAFRFAHLPPRMRSQLEDEPGCLDPWFVEPLPAEVAENTGSDGLVVLPREAALTDETLVVVARSTRFLDQGIAATLVKPDITELELTLVNPTPLRVRVVNSANRPLPGVPVALGRSHGDAARWGEAITDDIGEAPLHRFVSAVARSQARGELDPLFVQAVLPLEDKLAVRVPQDHDLSIPIELRLPATCELLLRVEGFPTPANGMVGLKAWPKMPGDFSIPQYSSPLVRLENGQARFPFVGPDYRYLLNIWIDGVTGVIERRIQSPAEPGSVEVLTVSIEQDMILKARLLDPRGRLMRNRGVNYRVGGTNWHSGASAHLDARGELTLLISEASIRSGLTKFEIDAWPLDPEVEGSMAVRAQIPDGFQPGVTDLGELMLERVVEGG